MASSQNARKFCLNLLTLCLLIPKEIFSSGPESSESEARKPINTTQRVPKFIAHISDDDSKPPNTIASFEETLSTNVDFAELDVLVTKDGHFVCHQSLQIKNTTDIASKPDLASLMVKNKTVLLDGKNVTIENDWLISDLTLEQVSTLKVKPMNQSATGAYRIPTLQQFLDTLNQDTWRKMMNGEVSLSNGSEGVSGIIPELKHPLYLNEHVFGKEFQLEQDFLEIIKSYGFLNNTCKYYGVRIPCSPVIVQCVDVPTIKYLDYYSNLTLMAKLDLGNWRYLTKTGIQRLVNKTDYVGIWKGLLYIGVEEEFKFRNLAFDKEEANRLGGILSPDEVISFAHKNGIKVSAFTVFNSKTEYKNAGKDVTKEEEIQILLDMDVDALHVEGLSDSLKYRDQWFDKKYPKPKEEPTTTTTPRPPTQSPSQGNWQQPQQQGPQYGQSNFQPQNNQPQQFQQQPGQQFQQQPGQQFQQQPGQQFQQQPGQQFQQPPGQQFPQSAPQFPQAPPAPQFPQAQPAPQFPQAPPAQQFPQAPQFPQAQPAPQFPQAPPAPQQLAQPPQQFQQPPQQFAQPAQPVNFQPPNPGQFYQNPYQSVPPQYMPGGFPYSPYGAPAQPYYHPYY